jgi:MFS family permease
VDLSQPEYLAFVMSLWSIAPLNGPSTGGIIGGFVFQYLGWRWSAWLVLILAGVAIACMATVKETYAPIILQRKAARLRKATDDCRWWCQYDQRISRMQLIKTNLSRPLILFVTEPILWFMNLWYTLTSARRSMIITDTIVGSHSFTVSYTSVSSPIQSCFLRSAAGDLASLAWPFAAWV